MRRTFMVILVAGAFWGTLAIPVSIQASAGLGFETHPRIRAAVRALEAASGDLQNAAHDYCGHRVEALEATNRAINQLGAAIACDQRRERRSTLPSVETANSTLIGSERHPNIRRAIAALERAKIDLQNAAHDYCGHRVEALEAVGSAIKQLDLALRCDKR